MFFIFLEFIFLNRVRRIYSRINGRSSLEKWKKRESARIKSETRKRKENADGNGGKILILSPRSDCLPLQILLATDFQSSLSCIYSRDQDNFWTTREEVRSKQDKRSNKEIRGYRREEEKKIGKKQKYVRQKGGKNGFFLLRKRRVYPLPVSKWYNEWTLKKWWDKRMKV